MSIPSHSWLITTATSNDITSGFNINVNNSSKKLTIGFDSTRTVANDTALTLGKEYDITVTLSNGKAKVDFIEVGTGTLYEGEEITIPSDWSSSTPLIIGALIGNTSFYTYGSIDLNSFKIYVDGNLIYQPCLKIPYTEAKNNNKVVDVLYRDRVKDLFEQEGYNGYYTVDEENKNFTLPTHQFNDVISYYKNGISVCEQKVDLSLFQQGNCTNGNEVTFIKPFRDTDYVLSIPYSAKSKTAFTPAQSGEWTAYGKTHL